MNRTPHRLARRPGPADSPIDAGDVVVAPPGRFHPPQAKPWKENR
jgi:hypothetical protein